ncbi:hypothetical protein A6R68_13128 [Neotoma lepida]|uniref:Anoctamin n=1 Tax=Neotoma lepida TaxID=56216 RepID=A0A1A6H3B3_NEOLE|nr:hypothetical protein A6R68_13128 [Neotoma lepida]
MKAMIIAFTSDMIPRLVYYWSFSIPPYGDHTSYTMDGYINNTLSIFNITDFRSTDKENPYIGYRDFRNPPGHPQEYKHNIYYWHVIAAKLAFIIVMEHVIYSVKFFISYAIPDVSKITKSKIKREKYLTQKLLHESHLKELTKNMGLIAERMGEGTPIQLSPLCCTIPGLLPKAMCEASGLVPPPPNPSSSTPHKKARPPMVVLWIHTPQLPTALNTYDWENSHSK